MRYALLFCVLCIVLGDGAHAMYVPEVVKLTITRPPKNVLTGDGTGFILRAFLEIPIQGSGVLVQYDAHSHTAWGVTNAHVALEKNTPILVTVQTRSHKKSITTTTVRGTVVAIAPPCMKKNVCGRDLALFSFPSQQPVPVVSLLRTSVASSTVCAVGYPYIAYVKSKSAVRSLYETCGTVRTPTRLPSSTMLVHAGSLYPGMSGGGVFVRTASGTHLVGIITRNTGHPPAPNESQPIVWVCALWHSVLRVCHHEKAPFGFPRA